MININSALITVLIAFLSYRNIATTNPQILLAGHYFSGNRTRITGIRHFGCPSEGNYEEMKRKKR